MCTNPVISRCEIDIRLMSNTCHVYLYISIYIYLYLHQHGSMVAVVLTTTTTTTTTIPRIVIPQLPNTTNPITCTTIIRTLSILGDVITVSNNTHHSKRPSQQ